MTTKAPEAWLGHMPEMPLSRGERVVDILAGIDGEQLTCLGEPNDTHGNTVCHSMIRGEVWPMHKSELRIDLGVTREFGHVLQWYAMRQPGTLAGDIRLRHFAGKTTPGDRLALAKACASIVASS